uniref:Uncharacterized protein n=1 Tax=viral metagenome TaxID=1070528 RepID=A0A6H1ZVT5_9ZZZZ
MKLQIDTQLKTIKIEEPINLGDFIKMLDGLFPKDAWKEYKLEVNTIYNWTNPLIIEQYRWYPYNPYYPGSPLWRTTSSSDITVRENNFPNTATYNVEIKGISTIA